MSAKKLTELSMLAGIALIIFVIELQIPNPFPVPGIKLGLANVITVYAVHRYHAREAAMALLYSAAGGTLCLTGMSAVKRLISEKHLWLSSAFGAIFHNAGQIAVAIAVTRTPALLAYFPYLLVSGCLAGSFTGFCAQLTIQKLEKRGARHLPSLNAARESSSEHSARPGA